MAFMKKDVRNSFIDAGSPAKSETTYVTMATGSALPKFLHRTGNTSREEQRLHWEWYTNGNSTQRTEIMVVKSVLGMENG
jgi:hypothetical protein